MERVVALIDMDCFYCQVELRGRPDLISRPLAVVQYNAWQGGAIIAVSYEARSFGVTRNMRGDEARRLCPDITLISVPESRGKADLSKYRDASKEVIDALTAMEDVVVERASIDEAYLDLTKAVSKRLEKGLDHTNLLDNTYVLGRAEEGDTAGWLSDCSACENENSLNLAMGAMLCEELRRQVRSSTGFHCSAGIASNKMLAKLACGSHKPNAQSVLPATSVSSILSKLPVGKLRGLGGKLGLLVRETLGCSTVGELASNFDLAALRDHLEPRMASMLYCMARGIDEEPVRERDLPKSIGCSKNFPGASMLDTQSKVRHWIRSLAQEVAQRMHSDTQVNQRRPKSISLHIAMENRGSCSRQAPLNAHDAETLANQAWALALKLNEANKEGNSNNNNHCNNNNSSSSSSSKGDAFIPRVRLLGISVSKFEKSCESLRSGAIKNFFKVAEKKDEVRENQQVHVDKKKESEDDVQSGSAFDLEPCPKCDRGISPFEMPEHLDFHVATEMQKAWTQEEETTSTSHRKRKSLCDDTNTRSSQGPKRHRDIASFFVKK